MRAHACEYGAVRLLAIDHVQLAAPPGCESTARAFFGELLGLDEVEKPEALRARGGAGFRGDGVEVHVGVEPEFAPARKAHPAFRVDDLGTLRERLTAAGLEPQDDTTIPGVRRFYVEDPWGNRLEFVDA